MSDLAALEAECTTLRARVAELERENSELRHDLNNARHAAQALHEVLEMLRDKRQSSD
jgi:cell division protein FtsB